MGEALLAAASDAGIRITLLDACYLRGGDGARARGCAATLRRRRRRALGRARRRVAADGAGACGSAPRSTACGPSTRPRPQRWPAWASERDAPLHAHVSEQPAENEACLAAYGRTPTGVLADAGAVDSRFTAVHATHVDRRRHRDARRRARDLLPVPDDRARSRRRRRPGGRGCAMRARRSRSEPTRTRSSTSSRRLARSSSTSGSSPAREDCTAPPTCSSRRAPAGYASLGWPEGGRIATGAPADFVDRRSRQRAVGRYRRRARARRDRLRGMRARRAPRRRRRPADRARRHPRRPRRRPRAHDAITAVRREHARRRPHRSAGHQRPRARRRAARSAARRGGRDRGRTCGRGRAPPAPSTPTSGSTPTAAASSPASSTATRTSCSRAIAADEFAARMAGRPTKRAGSASRPTRRARPRSTR